MINTFRKVGIVGAGAMGKGIAQLATQAGSLVYLFDNQPATVAKALDDIAHEWQTQVSKGKITSSEAAQLTQRLEGVQRLEDLADCDLVIEAVIEHLGVKRALLSDLARICPSSVLATNTSSLSITSIAAGHPHEAQIAGFHFFNPAPLMKIVEVVPGSQTHDSVVQRLCKFAVAMGHTPVVAQDTPGFIVNHAGRAFGTEALRILSEQITDFADIDRIPKDQAGFTLGTFELMELTGLDVSHPVMESVYRQYYDEPRYRPSVITAQRLSAGVLGKKSGKGFYNYPNGQIERPVHVTPEGEKNWPSVWVSPKAARRADLYQLLKNLGATIETTAVPPSKALILVAPLGLDVTTIAAIDQLDAGRTIGIDMLVEDKNTLRRVLATNPATRPDIRNAAWSIFSADGKAVSIIRDSGGFVTQRILAHIVNIASDMCQQGICTCSDLDTAAMLGLGYPIGPLTLGDQLGPGNVLEVLFNMQTVYGDPRYRPSPWLRRRGALGLSLKQVEI